MTQIHPVALRKLLAERFSLEELHTVCFDLGENADSFAGRVPKDELASKTVEHFQDRDCLCDLRYLQSAGCEGLEPVIELLERHTT